MAVATPVQQPDPMMDQIRIALYVSTPKIHAPLDLKTAVQTGQAKPTVGDILTSFKAPLFISTVLVKIPGNVGTGYIPVQPLTQWSGINLYGSYSNGVYTTGYVGWTSGLVSYFKLDANNVPVQIWDLSSGTGVWRPYNEFLGSLQPLSPLIMDKVLNDSDRQEVALNMASSGFFKARTTYIDIGDVVGGEGTIDLKGMLSADDYQQLSQYLTFMPRQFLRNFFMQKIYPGIPPAPAATADVREGTVVKDPFYGGTYLFKSYMDMVWAGFVDLFNVANLAYVNPNQIDPWAWEQQKLTAYYQSQNADAVASLQAKFDEYNDVTLALDPLAKTVMDDFATLPKLGDIGLEINRQNAIKELLKMKEYESAQAIVDAFRYTIDTVLGPALATPIASNIVLSDGTVIAEKSSSTSI